MEKPVFIIHVFYGDSTQPVKFIKSNHFNALQHAELMFKENDVVAVKVYKDIINDANCIYKLPIDGKIVS